MGLIACTVVMASRTTAYSKCGNRANGDPGRSGLVAHLPSSFACHRIDNRQICHIHVYVVFAIFLRILYKSL
jgi:hypothetical protein